MLNSALKDLRTLIKLEPQNQDAGKAAQRVGILLLKLKDAVESYDLALQRVSSSFLRHAIVFY